MDVYSLLVAKYFKVYCDQRFHEKGEDIWHGYCIEWGSEMTKKCSRLLGGCIKGSAADGHYEFMSFIIKGFFSGAGKEKADTRVQKGLDFARRVQWKKNKVEKNSYLYNNKRICGKKKRTGKKITSKVSFPRNLKGGLEYSSRGSSQFTSLYLSWSLSYCTSL